MWIQPKTDWSAQDYLDLEVDFSRIEGDIHEILLTVQAYGYSLTLDEKPTWTKQDFLTSAEYNRIVGNIASLEGILTVPPGLPALSEKETKAVLDYTDMNKLESHIAALKAVADGTAVLFVPCGVAQSGARPLLPV